MLLEKKVVIAIARVSEIGGIGRILPKEQFQTTPRVVVCSRYLLGMTHGFPADNNLRPEWTLEA